MTNQLFRDYLDGKIHVRKPFKPGRIYIAPVGQFLKTNDSTGWTELDATSPDGYMHTNSGDITPWSSPRKVKLQPEPWERMPNPNPNGPKPEPLHKRGRITKYRTKG